MKPVVASLVMSFKWSSIVAAAGAMTACGASIKTAVDYDRTVSFASYQTFFMVKGNSSGNSLLDQRTATDVQEALALRGWALVSDGDGRAAVVVHTATQTKHTDEAFYEGRGGWNWRRGGLGAATTRVDDYSVGTVVVDIFDARSKQTIWRGVATDAVSDNAKHNASLTQKAITKMFENFPPE